MGGRFPIKKLADSWDYKPESLFVEGLK